MSTRKLQVFVSSTYLDMLDERQAAVEAILRAGHIPAGMELFAAGDESQIEVIRRWIDESDAFLLILGGRYGSVEEKSGKSYIENEYNHAAEQGKRMFAVTASDGYLEKKTQMMGRSAIEADNGTLLAEFRKRVRSKICRDFHEISELKLAIVESLKQFDEDKSLVGWVRPSENSEVIATQAVDIQQLKARVQELEAEREHADTVSNDEAEEISDEEKWILLHANQNDGRVGTITTRITASLLVALETGIYTPDSISGISLSAFTNKARIFWTGGVRDLIKRKFCDQTFRPIKDNNRVIECQYTIDLNRLGFRHADKLVKEGFEISNIVYFS